MTENNCGALWGDHGRVYVCDQTFGHEGAHRVLLDKYEPGGLAQTRAIIGDTHQWNITWDGETAYLVRLRSDEPA